MSSLIKLFKEVHGDIDADRSSCYTEIETDDHGKEAAVNVMKDGNLCWSATKLDLVFDYIMKYVDPQ